MNAVDLWAFQLLHENVVVHFYSIVPAFFPKKKEKQSRLRQKFQHFDGLLRQKEFKIIIRKSTIDKHKKDERIPLSNNKKKNHMLWHMIC